MFLVEHLRRPPRVTLGVWFLRRCRGEKRYERTQRSLWKSQEGLRGGSYELSSMCAEKKDNGRLTPMCRPFALRSLDIDYRSTVNVETEATV